MKQVNIPSDGYIEKRIGQKPIESGLYIGNGYMGHREENEWKFFWDVDLGLEIEFNKSEINDRDRVCRN